MASTPGAGPVDVRRSAAATLTTLAARDVTIDGGFWAARQAVNRDAALPHGARMLEAAGNLDNLRLAAGKTTGRYRGPVFMDSDVYYAWASREPGAMRVWIPRGPAAAR